jgi:hypothetical protein
VNSHYYRKLVGTWAVVSIALTSIALAGRAQDKTPSTQERIGVYDSRAVALAYAGSTWQGKKMKELTAQLKKAREAGDTNTAWLLEAEGRAWQSDLKQQGFGTAPVDNLLAEIASDLPLIFEAAGVTGVISKWNKTELDKHPHAVRVDVTMRLVDAFQPSDTQGRRAIEIQKTKPQKIKE